ncbi:biotin synthase BioB [Sphingobacterium sp. lm-10]|uniref:biotin synthase BioB n=1 Tax=Sphingobacterium sp. lm-10 TaxID=2944904 RepID=UPI0020219503|nr:biotin synthase BioB [Sphingobacterium sp. lm-10]MCL7987244.1 biotin synthase BioB [Sphingobacterium sp. lm-10]
MQNNPALRNDWTKKEVEAIYQLPLLELIYQAATVHRTWHKPQEIQLCTLLSVKTGGCPEDCAYCGQAARYQTGIQVQALLSTDVVLAHAQKAKDVGSSRFCMAAAWREVRDNRDFDRVIDMVKGVNALGLEVCCTLGMLTEGQAERLKEAGVHAYNHNLDTSEAYYEQVISTRQFDQRVNTLHHVRKAGMTVCSGGIVGLGETPADRIAMLVTLATLPQHPDSVPVNALVRVKGTPLEHLPKVSIWDMVRTVATARIIMPAAMVRLSAGRMEMSEEEQAWCFMAGANSIFTGERETLLVTPNPGVTEDMCMLDNLGLIPMVKQNKVHESATN